MEEMCWRALWMLLLTSKEICREKPTRNKTQACVVPITTPWGMLGCPSSTCHGPARAFVTGVCNVVMGPLSPLNDTLIFRWEKPIYFHIEKWYQYVISWRQTQILYKELHSSHYLSLITYINCLLGNYVSPIEWCLLGGTVNRLSCPPAKEWQLTWAGPIWPSIFDLWMQWYEGGKKWLEFIHSSSRVEWFPLLNIPTYPLWPPNHLVSEPGSPGFHLILWATSNIFVKKIFFLLKFPELVSDDWWVQNLFYFLKS